MTRTEDRLGVAKAVGTSYTNLGTVAASTTWNLTLQAVNKTSGAVVIRAFVADSSWSTGEPTGSTLQYAICYDFTLEAGQTVQFGPEILLTGEKLIVRSDTASAVDFVGMGVKIT